MKNIFMFLFFFLLNNCLKGNCLEKLHNYTSFAISNSEASFMPSSTAVVVMSSLIFFPFIYWTGDYFSKKRIKVFENINNRIMSECRPFIKYFKTDGNERDEGEVHFCYSNMRLEAIKINFRNTDYHYDLLKDGCGNLSSENIICIYFPKNKLDGLKKKLNEIFCKEFEKLDEYFKLNIFEQEIEEYKKFDSTGRFKWDEKKREGGGERVDIDDSIMMKKIKAKLCDRIKSGSLLEWAINNNHLDILLCLASDYPNLKWCDWEIDERKFIKKNFLFKIILFIKNNNFLKNIFFVFTSLTILFYLIGLISHKYNRVSILLSVLLSYIVVKSFFINHNEMIFYDEKC